MKLLFENWRRYVLNELTLDQVKERLAGNFIKKIIKSNAYEFMKDYEKDYPQDSKVHKMILEDEVVVEVFARVYADVLERMIMFIDLDEKQKASALNWLISIGKTDKSVAEKELDGSWMRDGPTYHLSRSIYADIFVNTVEIGETIEQEQITGDIQDLRRMVKIPARPDKVKSYISDPDAWRRRISDLQLERADYIQPYMQILRPALEKFFHYQQFMPEKDINQIKGVQELVQTTREADEAIKKYQEQKSYEDVDEGTEVFKDDESVFIAAIHNKGAACHFGKDTDWCTAAPGLNYFKTYYREDNPLIIVIDKDGSLGRGGYGSPGAKYQFHYATKQFMDKEDIPVEGSLEGKLHIAIMKTDIPNKYPKIKNDFIDIIELDMPTDSFHTLWAGLLELGWDIIPDILTNKIPYGLRHIERDAYARMGSTPRSTTYHNFITNGLQKGDLGLIAVIIISAFVFKAFGVIPDHDKQLQNIQELAKRYIQSNISAIVSAIPENATYFKEYPNLPRGMAFRSHQQEYVNRSILWFLRQRTFYDALPDNLKEKFVRLLEYADQASRETTNVTILHSLKRGLGLPAADPDTQKGEVPPPQGEEEELSDIKERWQKLAGTSEK